RWSGARARNHWRPTPRSRRRSPCRWDRSARAAGRTGSPSTTPTRTSTRSRRCTRSPSSSGTRRRRRSWCRRSRAATSPEAAPSPRPLPNKHPPADPRTARVSVFVPEGLEATDPVRELKLDGWKQQDLTVPITNRTALAGSRYPVFVVAEYDDGAVHESTVAQGMVSVIETQSFFSRNTRFLWIGAGVLVALWLAIVVIRGVGRSAGAT